MVPTGVSNQTSDARGETDAPRGLSALDERILQGAPGILLVEARGTAAAHAVREHVVRVARTSSTLALAARARDGAPLWHEVLLHLQPLGTSARAEDAVSAAQHLITAAHGHRVVVVAPLPAAASWDRTVAHELAGRAHPFMLVFLTDSANDTPTLAGDSALQAEEFVVSEQLGSAERDNWWSALAESASQELGGLSLSALESWWTNARRAGHDETGRHAETRALTASESALLVALALVGRPWRAASLAELGVDPDAAAALLRDGLIAESLGWLTVDSRVDELAMTAAAPLASVRTVAAALAALASKASGGTDPWALAHAAHLYLAAGEFTTADAAMERALTQVEETVARSEMTGRWAIAVAACHETERLFLQRRGAERALAIGEAEEAHRWAKAASALAPNDVSVTLLLGRSLAALGDLVAAEVTLRRGERELSAAGENTPDRRLQALVWAELAEIAYLKGDMASAGTMAASALATAGTRSEARDAVSKARNTLGKILLAEAKWDDADRHFAEDALSAASCNDATAELRARLNRGIAFLSNGALDEARSVFEEVRSEGERLGDFRAAAFALDNLAVVATWRHEYADALTLSERTLTLRRRLGDRLTTARIVGNLAELRRKLGLLQHAEHAIAFGRRALGPGMPPERSAHFSFVAARIALDRGHTDTAQREITRAIRDAELAGHRRILAESHRVASRIALEDGDLSRARASLDASRETTTTDEARAEVALLDALVARAAGEDAEALALAALSLARVVGEEEGLLESHLLLCEIHRAHARLDAARSHLNQAISLRDQVVVGLPSDVAAAFLARRDVALLSALETQLAESVRDSSPGCVDSGSGSELRDSAPRSSGAAAGRSIPPAPSHAELVGTDALMRGLQATIKKVARSNTTVLIRGESGTGKELVAAALHRASERASGPMVTVNCAALVETLLLSELFGHEKGAFTGASARRRGRFELADGGTLFLDEIGDISSKTQVALLRVLQERTFERVGGTVPIHVDVHVICATHRDLRAMVERGEFREDLYYRLRGITLDVPALRARKGDLPALADHLLGRIAVERREPKKSLSPAALDLLSMHHWPGNVRELENALRAASLFAETATISVANLTDNIDDLRRAAEKTDVARNRPQLVELASGDGGREIGRANDTLAPPSPSVFATAAAATAVAAPPPTVRDGLASQDDLSGAFVDSRVDGDEAIADGEAPLPDSEANATAVAYAQVRQGALSLSDMKRQIERDCIARALAETKGNITRAAALLGMKRPRLSQLVKHYGLAAVSSEAT